ncbi:hypothetical protein ALISP_6907 [Alicycliphilus sp. B1]|nr:hypothetical protein ALISP_6907 [Alicycliphilus sp. B1]
MSAKAIRQVVSNFELNDLRNGNLSIALVEEEPHAAAAPDLSPSSDSQTFESRTTIMTGSPFLER